MTDRQDKHPGRTSAQATSAARQPGTPAPKPRSTWKRKLLFYFLGFVGCVAAVGALAAFLLLGALARTLPSIDWARDYRPPIVTNIVSGDEQLIGEQYVERRKVVPYEKVPKKLVQALIASEDKDFFDHHGVSFTGVARALFKTFVLHRRVQGGSTLSQQTAKAILASTEGVDTVQIRHGWKGIRRKLREYLLTRRLESHFNKEQILFLYLNEVYLGHQSYGVQAAAENYFRKNVWELSLPEIALLAGLPQAPSKYSPFSHPELAKKRRTYVLRRMREEGMISEAEAEQAQSAPIKVFPVQNIFLETAPYVTEHVRRDLVARYGEERMLHEGLQAFTTVDVQREQDAVAATLKGVLEVDKRQGFRGPLTQLDEKDWDAFAKKEQAFLTGEGKGESVFAALVTSVDKDGKGAQVRVGKREGHIPLALAAWARKPNPEINAEFAKISTLRGVLNPGDVVLVRDADADELKAKDREREAGKTLFALEQEPQLEGALLSMDPVSGYVVAMIGGTDFEKNQYNRAFQACRQPGSSFKPLIYSAAIELQGFTASTMLLDAPVVTDDESTGKRWKPQDFEEKFEGEVPVRLALIHSMNIPAIRTLMAVGVKSAAQWAHHLGISTPIEENLSMALGSSCVTLWDLTNVYAVFDSQGRRVHPVFLSRVLDRDGRTLEDHSSFYDPWSSLSERVAAAYAKVYAPEEQLIKPETAFLITQLMSEVTREGTGAAAHRELPRIPVAGKTGTTNDLFDAWFMGYSHDLVTGVWVGPDDYKVPMDRYETGGHTALPIWIDFMRAALKGRHEPEFEAPDDIVWASIDGKTGKRVPQTTRGAVLEAYLKGTAPEDANASTAPASSAAAAALMNRGGL